MDFDKIFSILEYIIPIVVTAVLARYANKNSYHWTTWVGRGGKIVGLMVAVLDIFRGKEEYINDIKKKPVKIGKKPVKMGIKGGKNDKK